MASNSKVDDTLLKTDERKTIVADDVMNGIVQGHNDKSTIPHLLFIGGEYQDLWITNQWMTRVIVCSERHGLHCMKRHGVWPTLDIGIRTPLLSTSYPSAL